MVAKGGFKLISKGAIQSMKKINKESKHYHS